MTVIILEKRQQQYMNWNEVAARLGCKEIFEEAGRLMESQNDQE